MERLALLSGFQLVDEALELSPQLIAVVVAASCGCMCVGRHFFHRFKCLLFRQFLYARTLPLKISVLGRLHGHRNLFIAIRAINKRFDPRELFLRSPFTAEAIVIWDHFRDKINTLLSWCGGDLGRVSAMDQIECFLDLHSIGNPGRNRATTWHLNTCVVFWAVGRQIWEPRLQMLCISLIEKWLVFRTFILLMWEYRVVWRSLEQTLRSYLPIKGLGDVVEFLYLLCLGSFLRWFLHKFVFHFSWQSDHDYLFIQVWVILFVFFVAPENGRSVTVETRSSRLITLINLFHLEWVHHLLKYMIFVHFLLNFGGYLGLIPDIVFD